MTKKTPFSKADVKIASREKLYQGFMSLEKLTLQHKLYQGGWSEKLQRECLVRRPVVALLPYDPIRDEVVLIQQFRVGALQHENPWLLEIVAGISEPNESMEDMIMREAFEEAGIVPLELIKLYEYWVSPGASTENLTLYYGRIDSSNAGGFHGLPNEHEDIRAITMSSDEAFNAMETGDINNAATIIALQWLALNRDKMKTL